MGQHRYCACNYKCIISVSNVNSLVGAVRSFSEIGQKTEIFSACKHSQLECFKTKSTILLLKFF